MHLLSRCQASAFLLSRITYSICLTVHLPVCDSLPVCLPVFFSLYSYAFNYDAAKWCGLAGIVDNKRACHPLEIFS